MQTKQDLLFYESEGYNVYRKNDTTFLFEGNSKKLIKVK